MAVITLRYAVMQAAGYPLCTVLPAKSMYVIYTMMTVTTVCRFRFIRSARRMSFPWQQRVEDQLYRRLQFQPFTNSIRPWWCQHMATTITITHWRTWFRTESNPKSKCKTQRREIIKPTARKNRRKRRKIPAMFPVMIPLLRLFLTARSKLHRSTAIYRISGMWTAAAASTM